MIPRKFANRLVGLAILSVIVYFSWRPVSQVKSARAQPLSQEAVKIAISNMRLRHPSTGSTADKKSTALMTLGKRFFFDKKLSANGQVSCATCHQPEKSFTDGRVTAVGIATTGMNTPTLVNSYFGQWFFWDGRSDSLEAQALGPVENALEHGFSRVQVATLIASEYKKEYEELFGRLPAALPTDPAVRLPASPHSMVSNEVAAYALATLGNQDFQKQVLKTAQSQSKQPVEILRTSSAGAPEPKTPFDQRPEAQKLEINIVFANFGRAVAEFERSIETTDSPFDLFADNVAKNEKNKGTNKEDLNSSFVAGFGAAELRGLELFVGRGNCTLCHQGSHFTDQQFHNIGLMALATDHVDLGRTQGMLIARNSEFNCRGKYLPQKSPSEGCRELEFLETESAEAVGAFKTPTLRNLRDTGPYGHDGRFPKLIDILQHYNHLAMPPAVGHTEELLLPLDFNQAELHDLESLLMSLSGSVTFFKGG